MDSFQYPLISIIIGRVFSPHNASVRHQLEEKMQMMQSVDKGYPLKTVKHKFFWLRPLNFTWNIEMW